MRQVTRFLDGSPFHLSLLLSAIIFIDSSLRAHFDKRLVNFVRDHFPADMLFHADILNRRVHVFPLYTFITSQFTSYQDLLGNQIRDRNLVGIYVTLTI